jgi:hypothetical protein
MKSNPLTLGNKKLAAATNMLFEEGRMRTRYGFDYKNLEANGQFQGACEYRPKEGLSAFSHSEADSGIAVVTDGVLWFNCNPVSLELFSGSGAVHIYQAENYLILQNPESDTFWWNGDDEPVRSPGTIEQDWIEPEVPVYETEVVAPTAVDVYCDLDGDESGITVRFLVIDHYTDRPISNVSWAFKHNSSRAYYGLSNAEGKFSLRPRPRAYHYDLRKAGYSAIEDTRLQIDGLPVVRQWDDCLPPTTDVVGNYDFTVRMTPVYVLVLVLDQTGSIGSAGAQRGIDIIDTNKVQAIGYISFGDSICYTRDITTDLSAVRAELVEIANYEPFVVEIEEGVFAYESDLPFYCDPGGDTPENGVDAINAGLELLNSFTGIPGANKTLFFKTDTRGYGHNLEDPEEVNTRLNQIHAAWLEFEGDPATGENGLYVETFPETSVVSHSNFIGLP